MSKKKKDFLPKNIEELEEIFYGQDKDGKDIDWRRFRQYEDWLEAKVMAPSYEDHTKRIFSPLGKVDKIPENQEKPTFDYKIDEHKILLEITSMRLPISVIPTPITQDWLIGKLKEVTDHILEKDASAFPDFFKGGIVIYSILFNLSTEFYLKLDEKLPKLSGIMDNDLDFIAFIPQPASISGESSFDKYPIVFYVKDSPLAEIFKSGFRDKDYKIIVLKQALL